MTTRFLLAPKIHIIMKARYTNHYYMPDSVDNLVGTPYSYFLSKDSALRPPLQLLMEARGPTGEYDTTVLDRDENGRPTAFTCSGSDRGSGAAYWIVSDVQGSFVNEGEVLGFVTALTANWG
ncbi:hypothetical protein HBI56_122070 [Parastagonospora nodorum]|uniref:Uncharacterized protein n=2 Tax=Phaeosphaeria nodorum (strain SN15 / ATCC MYA-4574 / FGSC 10173) TaxID=321614 RepID=A0A7U2FBE2_PHANO|nr:hypothetical protein SNOG_05165 [Parastagonospora nodorum SN15]KAH3917122.1 hypothetical protein HBH56_052630 [Parastagonospora nodorum]EAT87556.1 hypothetical protein SNOG_05165 [Parastagonospora nodorum SN15]KAH3935862.1 hypothetical protein HBH54_038430 [Parastagonospora nodorum]KAH3970106.1 hypothetical protein HBH51_118420 [Parastagonospora nodorum]KAH3997446.1 hypothetical protein HBI10_140960 [Parastagonospora nodorum]